MSAADVTFKGEIMEIHFMTDKPITLFEIENLYINAILEKYEGNKMRAAKALGISRMKLGRRIEPKTVADLPHAPDNLRAGL